MGGLVRSSFQKVQIIDELKVLYASFMLSFSYRLCGLYKGNASTKKSLKKLCMLILCFYVYSCSDVVMVHSIYYAYMRKYFHLTAILAHGRIFSKDSLLC